MADSEDFRRLHERMDSLTEANVRLLRRVAELERQVGQLRGLAPEAASAPEFSPTVPASVDPQPAPSLARETVREDLSESANPMPTVPAEEPQALETRVGLAWLNRLAVVTCILAAAFFFKYAVDNEWIGPWMRVLLGVAAGLLSLGGAGRFRRRGEQIYAQGLSGLGISLLYLSFQASFAFYGLIPAAAALVLMTLTTILAGALALRYDSRAIAVLALIGGYATPPLLSTGDSQPVFVMSYSLVLSAAAIWLARQKRWSFVEGLALAGTVLLVASGLEQALREERRLLTGTFILAGYALFATSPGVGVAYVVQAAAAVSAVAIWEERPIGFYFTSLVVAAGGLGVAARRGWPSAPLVAFASAAAAVWMWSSYYGAGAAVAPVIPGATALFALFLAWLPWRALTAGRPSSQQDLALLPLSSGAYYALLYGLMRVEYEPYLGLITAALGVVHFALGRILRNADSRAGLLHLGVGLAFVTLAVPLQFSEFRIAVAWALEGAALAWIARRTGAPQLGWIAAAVLAASAVPLPGAPLLAYFTVAAGFALASLWFAPPPIQLGSYVAAHVVLLVGLGGELIDWVGARVIAENVRNAQSLAVSLLCAVYAVLLVGAGVATRSAINRILGLALIAFVILKLYAYDVWELRLLYRVAAFAGLGALLLVTSFLYSRFRGSIENWWQSRG